MIKKSPPQKILCVNNIYSQRQKKKSKLLKYKINQIIPKYKNIFNNVWFIYNCQDFRKKPWYTNYKKKCEIRNIKTDQKERTNIIKEKLQILLPNRHRKQKIYFSKKQWYYHKQLQQKKIKLIKSQRTFKKLYHTKNLNKLYNL